jgi:hypothetical protein
MKKIGIEDLFKEIDIFRQLRESANKTIQTLEKMKSESKDIAQSLQKLLSINKLDSAKSINELSKAQEKSNKLVQEAIKIDMLRQKAIQQKIKSTQELTRLESTLKTKIQETTKAERDAVKAETEKIQKDREQIKLTRDLEREEERKQKQQARSERLSRQQTSAYLQLAKSTRDLKNQSKDLGAEMLKLEQSGRRNTAEYRKLQTQYQQVTTQAQKADQQLKNLDKTVGDNFRNVGNYESAMNKLSNAFGAFGVAFGIAPVVQNVTASVMSFELANSELAAVLGTTVDKTGQLQKVQRELGRGTAFTAGQVGELQVELAKLGFTTPEILNSSEAVLKLAGATRSDLARSSEIAGATLRGFGLQADQMNRVVNVMAKGFSISALDLESFAESMKYVAPVAQQAGFTLEETTALLGQLSNAGIKGSQAGTSLRRIFTDMALTGKPAKEALAEVTKNGVTLTDAFDEVGRTAQTALAVIGNNMGTVDEMSKALLNADGAVNQMYDTMTNNLKGAFDRLSSSFEAYILDANESSGASKELTKMIDFLANNLHLILDVIVTGVKYFGLWKIATLAQVAANRLLATSSAGLFGSIQTGFARMGTALKTNAIGIFVTAIVVGLMKIKSMLDTMNAPFERVNALNEKLGSISKEASKQIAVEEMNLKILVGQIKSHNAGSQERGALLEQLNEKYGTHLKNIKDETLANKQLDLAQRQIIANMRNTILLQARQEQYAEIVRTVTEAEDEYNATLGKRRKEVAQMTDKQVNNQLKRLASYSQGYSDKMNATFAKMSMAEKRRFLIEDNLSSQDLAKKQALEKLRKQELGYENKLTTQMKKTTQATLANTEVTGNLGTTVDKTTEKTKEYKTQLKEVNDYLERNIELTQELLQIDQDRQVKALTDQINQVVEQAQQDVKDTDVFDIQLRVAAEGEDQSEVDKENLDALIEADSELNQLIDERFRLEKRNLEQRAQFEKDALARKNEVDIEEQRNQLLEDRNALIADLDIKEGVTPTKQQATAKAEIEKNYQKRIEELRTENAQRYSDLAKEQLLVDEKLKDDVVKLEEDKTQAVKEENEKILESWKTNADKKKAITDKTNEEEIASEKRKQEALQALIKSTSDYFIKRSDEKIKQLEKEISQAEKNQSYLEELAQQGNINAKQSLAENQKIIDEANKKKMLEEQRQQRIKLAETALTTYSQKVEDGSPTPLADTIRDIALLQQFVSSLPAFEEGIEDTGSNGRGVDGRGGFHAILHPNERVVPKSLNEKIGSMSNEELASIAQEYQNGRIMRDGMQIASAMDTLLIANKIDELNQTIRNKPETNIELGEITSSMMEIVKSTKKGNTTMFNRYKIKK